MNPELTAVLGRLKASGDITQAGTDALTTMLSERQAGTDTSTKQSERFGKITVHVRNGHASVTDVFKFSETVQLPSTLGEFWKTTGLGDEYRQDTAARVTVKMINGQWSRLDGSARITAEYSVDEAGWALFQLARNHTPNTSPCVQPVEGAVLPPADFAKCVNSLFQRNPFGDKIPTVFRDAAITNLESFFAARDIDSCVISLIMAMPGSGKTRTVVEAAKNYGYRRVKMSCANFSSGAQVEEYLTKQVAALCECSESNIPTCTERSTTLVMHFDEVQSLMITPEGEKEALIVALAKACDRLVHFDGAGSIGIGGRRNWLKFVMTGTNIFSTETIHLHLGSQVKHHVEPLDGAFSFAFAERLLKQYIPTANTPLLEKVVNNYLERCRHNRRVTEYFLRYLWEIANTKRVLKEKDFEEAYDSAFCVVQTQIRDDIKKNNDNQVNIAKVACTVFAKVLTIDRDASQNSNVLKITKCSAEERAYIGGGGLNVHRLHDASSLEIYSPKGCGLELLEAFIIARGCGSLKSRTTVIDFLRVSSALSFGIKGHLFEWLIAHDITCPKSEFDMVDVTRKNVCIGAKPTSDPQVANLLVGEVDKEGVWVVRDTHNSHQNRWIDVAYSINVPSPLQHAFTRGFVIMECKTGYKKQKSKLSEFCNRFFKAASDFASQHPNIFWVAVFACQYSFPTPSDSSNIPGNLQTKVRVIDADSCYSISSYLMADPANDDDVMDAVDDLETDAVASSQGVPLYHTGGTPQATPSRPFKKSKGDF